MSSLRVLYCSIISILLEGVESNGYGENTQSFPIEVFADIAEPEGNMMRFSKVINFDIDLGHSPIGTVPTFFVHSPISVEEVKFHHLLHGLHRDIELPTEHRVKIKSLRSLFSRMVHRLKASGAGYGHYIHPEPQKLCREKFERTDIGQEGELLPDQRSSHSHSLQILAGNPQLVACLMGATEGYFGVNGEYETHCAHYHGQRSGSNATTITHRESILCAALVKCGIFADTDHDGKIGPSEEVKYGQCVSPYLSLFPQHRHKRKKHTKKQAAKDPNRCTLSAEDCLTAYNDGAKYMADILRIGHGGHLKPNLWKMTVSGARAPHHVFRVWKDPEVEYKWRVSRGEMVCGGTAFVAKHKVIITGPEGKEWSAGKMKKFKKRFDRIERAGDGDHGTCHYRKGVEERALKMKYAVAVYHESRNPGQPQIAEAGWYLVDGDGTKRHYASFSPSSFRRVFTTTNTSTPAETENETTPSVVDKLQTIAVSVVNAEEPSEPKEPEEPKEPKQPEEPKGDEKKVNPEGSQTKINGLDSEPTVELDVAPKNDTKENNETAKAQKEGTTEPIEAGPANETGAGVQGSELVKAPNGESSESKPSLLRHAWNTITGFFSGGTAAEKAELERVTEALRTNKPLSKRPTVPLSMVPYSAGCCDTENGSYLAPGHWFCDWCGNDYPLTFVMGNDEIYRFSQNDAAKKPLADEMALFGFDGPYIQNCEMLLFPASFGKFRAFPTTWDGVLAQIGNRLEGNKNGVLQQVWEAVLALKEELKTTPLAEIKRRAGFDFETVVDKDCPHYTTTEDLEDILKEKGALTVDAVRLWFYCQLELKEGFRGDGYVDFRGRKVTLYLMENARLDDIPLLQRIPIAGCLAHRAGVNPFSVRKEDEAKAANTTGSVAANTTESVAAKETESVAAKETESVAPKETESVAELQQKGAPTLMVRGEPVVVAAAEEPPAVDNGAGHTATVSMRSDVNVADEELAAQRNGGQNTMTVVARSGTPEVVQEEPTTKNPGGAKTQNAVLIDDELTGRSDEGPGPKSAVDGSGAVNVVLGKSAATKEISGDSETRHTTSIKLKVEGQADPTANGPESETSARSGTEDGEDPQKLNVISEPIFDRIV